MTNMSGTFLNSGACDAGPQGEGKESPSNAGPTHTAGSGKYQPYPDYKDSDVEWLGEVPSDWVLQRLKFLCHITTGDKDTVEREEEGLYPFFVRSDTVERISTYSFDGEAVLTAGDGAIGKIFHHINGKFDFHQRVYKFSDFKYVNGRYFYHYISNNLANEVIKLSAKTTVDSLRLPMLQNFVFVLPPIEHQVTIAAFLDYETARIDQLIAKQQQLIELLKEKRQAVISHAVTKGLNPNAPMKDSGVEWLGQVPKHWGVSALGYYSKLNTGATPDRSQEQYWGGSIPWIKTGEVRYETIYETEETITQTALSETSVRLSVPGTLLMAMYGQGITRGRVAILGVSAAYNQACVAINPNQKIGNDFLKFFFMAGYDALRDGGNETSQMNLNADIVSKFKILVPPLDEQYDIVSLLELKLTNYDKLIIKSEDAIALMQERRTALISAAVTGKIDLRGWQPPKSEVAS